MIFISAGHNKKARGAAFKDVNEFDEAIQWQKEVMALLGDKAISVPSGTLGSKVRFINAKILELRGPHTAVEIHFNSDPNQGGRGSETLYYPNSYYGQALAQKMQEKLGIVFGPDRGAKEGWYQMNEDKGPDYFLAKTNCPALIIEPEFIHNYEKIREGQTPGCIMISEVLLGEIE